MPKSAVKAGLDLVAKVGQLLLPSHDPLQIRVGIATGVVIVGESIGEGSSREQAAVGETPNLASRLQSVAPQNTVVVSASTRRILGEIFVFEDLKSIELKGISGLVKAWRVSAASERSRAASKPSCPASLRSSLAGRMN